MYVQTIVRKKEQRIFGYTCFNKEKYEKVLKRKLSSWGYFDISKNTKSSFFSENFSFIHVLSKCWMMLMNSKETVEGKSQIIYTRNDKVDN